MLGDKELCFSMSSLRRTVAQQIAAANSLASGLTTNRHMPFGSGYLNLPLVPMEHR
jgi:hypothetical protein